MFSHYTSGQFGLKGKEKKERTSQFWILARLASSKEPIYSNTDLAPLCFLRSPNRKTEWKQIKFKFYSLGTGSNY